MTPSPEMGFRPMPEMPANLESASRKACELTKKHALRPEDFVYENEQGTNKFTVQSDLRYVDKRKSMMESTDSPEYKLAKSLEAALYERINHSKWFGERTAMIMPSEYDDLYNGVDGILEFRQEQGPNSYLGMAVDVTYNHDPSAKFDIIKEQIDQARLGEVKYFRSSDGSDQRPLKNMTRGIVVMAAVDATRTVRDWEQGTADSGGRIRAEILRQLELQLEAYQHYATGLEMDNPKRFNISRFFKRAKKNVSALLSEFVNPEDLAELDNHQSIQVVKQQLKKFVVANQEETHLSAAA